MTADPAVVRATAPTTVRTTDYHAVSEPFRIVDTACAGIAGRTR